MRKELTITELDSQHVELLPDRETLLFFVGNKWAQVNAYNNATAVQALTAFSANSATAVQGISVIQNG
jgi:hypothetical protein